MKKYLTPINKLHLSVIGSWAILLLTILYNLAGDGWGTGKFSDNLIIGIFWGYVLLSLRYSVFKPVELLGAALSGWATMSILDYLSRGHNSESGPNILYWTFVLLVFAYYFIKGVILSTYFLLRETYQLVKYYRNKTQFVQNIQVQ